MRSKLIVLFLSLLFIVGAESSMALWAMDVDAPENTLVGEEITITVTSDGSPVEGADVYINTVDNIGETDGNGEITHTFNILGIYSVRASKGFDSSNTIYVTVENPLLSITLDPWIPKVNEEFTIIVKSNLIDEVDGATVMIDGETIGSTDSNGEIAHTFQEGGSHTVTATKNGYIDANTFTVDVPEIEVMQTISMEGAVLPIPDSLENLLGDKNALQDLFQMHGPYLVMNASGLFAVYSDEKIEKGLASVEGTKVISVNWDGMDVCVIDADEVDVETDGDSCSISDIESNPENYAYQCVEVSGTVAQCPFMVDVPGFNMPVNVGRLCDVDSLMLDFSEFIDSIYDFNENFDGNILDDFLGYSSNSLAFFDFDEPSYWCNAEATVDAIVMYPDLVKEFTEMVSENEIANAMIPIDESVVLYVLDMEFESETVEIDDITKDSAGYSGDIVSFEGSYLGIGASVKKIISDVSGQIGNLLPVDLSLHGDLVWMSPPSGDIEAFKDECVFVFGASSISQGMSVSSDNGASSVYRFTGEVISPSWIDDSLNGAVVLVYEREKVRDLSAEEISGDVSDFVEGEVSNFEYILKGEEVPSTEGSDTQDDDTETTDDESQENEDKTDEAEESIDDDTGSSPSAYFSCDINSPVVGDVIYFSDESMDDDNDIVSWNWNFGDGDYSSSRFPSHEYSKEGTYAVSLEVTDSEDNSDSFTQSIMVSDSSSDSSTSSGSDESESSDGIGEVSGVKTEDDVGGTPGFEIVLLLCSILFMLYWKRNKIKKK